MALHVAHLAVKAVVEPAQQVPLVLRDRDAGHAECAEAQGAGARLELAFQRRQVRGGKLRHGVITADSIMSTMALPVAMYSTSQVRALDAHAIEVRAYRATP